MKRPVLEVIRFEEPDLIATSGLGMTMSNFGDRVPNNGAFTFFGGSSGDKSHDAHEENIVSAFNSYFVQHWSSTGDIYVDGNFGGATVEGMIDNDSDGPENLDDQKYNGTYYYTFFSDSDGSSYYFRSH